MRCRTDVWRFVFFVAIYGFIIRVFPSSLKMNYISKWTYCVTVIERAMIEEGQWVCNSMISLCLWWVHLFIAFNWGIPDTHWSAYIIKMLQMSWCQIGARPFTTTILKLTKGYHHDTQIIFRTKQVMLWWYNFEGRWAGRQLIGFFVIDGFILPWR